MQAKECSIDKTILKRDKIPNHIAIIMDGNGRWAKTRGLPRIAGHWAGAETLREIIEFCSDIDIKVLSVFAFSTENWKRPYEEVSSLLNMLLYYFKKEVAKLDKNNVKIIVSGDWRVLPEKIVKEIDKSIKLTEQNSGLILNILLNYGSRQEIVTACKKICEDVSQGKIRMEDINEDLIAAHLFSCQIPDPDLLIRPSGEIRISNCFLWQIAYAELYFTETYWPDFKPEDLYKAILDYQNRDRRFGGIKK